MASYYIQKQVKNLFGKLKWIDLSRDCFVFMDVIRFSISFDTLEEAQAYLANITTPLCKDEAVG